jgi:uroporphyrinogen decarboxylase
VNSKERVRAAYQHKEPDRVPVGEMHIMSPVASEILGREAVTGEGGWLKYTKMRMLREGRRAEFMERLCKDTLDVFRGSGLDLVTTELDPPSEDPVAYEDVGEKGWKEVDKETGLWARFAYVPENDTVHEVGCSAKEGEGYEAIRLELDALEKSLARPLDDAMFESTRYMADHAGGEMFLMAKAPDLIPSYRSWYPKFMEILHLDPELAHRVCDLYLARAKRVAARYIEIGVDCVMIASDWASANGPIFSPAHIREYLIPQMESICALCHERGVFVLKHTDGNIMQFADDFFAMPIDGYQSVDPGAGMDIALVKRRWGGKVLLMGNVDCARTLPYGTKEDVARETRGVIAKASAGGGHILSSSNTIGYPTRAANFLTMVETAHEAGAYPIDPERLLV